MSKKVNRKIFVRLIIAILIFGSIFSGTVYYKQTHKSYYLEVVFDSTVRPYVKATIGSQQLYLLFDLGSVFPLALEEDYLENLDKLRYGIVSPQNIRGRYYTTPSYVIPEIRLGSLIFKNVLAHGVDSELASDTVLGIADVKQMPVSNFSKSGAVGSTLFSDEKIFLDFKNSSIVIERGTEDPRLSRFVAESSVSVPFSLLSGLIFFSVETDIGRDQYLLDTGLTGSLIYPSVIDGKESLADGDDLQTFSTKKFIIGEHDFGTQELFVFPFFQEGAAHKGMLGVDFLLEHSVLIDYENRTLYIEN